MLPASSLTFARLMFGVAVFAVSTHAHAQQTAGTTRTPWEFVMSSGTLVPTGLQRAAIARGAHSGALLSYLFSRRVAATAALGWTRSRDVASANDAKLDLFMYDAGLEWRTPRERDDRRITFAPLAGAGVGARTYDVRGAGARTTHDATAYLTFGGELAYARLRLRLDARSYLSSAAPFGRAGARHDVVIAAGLRWVRK